MNQKKDIRKHFSAVRNRLSALEVSQKSGLIEQRLLQSEEYKNADIIHSFVSIAENKEVDTQGIIQKSLQAGKIIVVPKVVEGRVLKHYRITSLDDLTLNRWKIPEPATGEEIAAASLDLILVPMLAADRAKNRIGYGKGFYDLFLTNCDAVKAGLVFSCQVYAKTIPAEPFDVPMDILFTEDERID